MKTPRQFLTFSVFICALTCTSSAHEDTIITLEGGRLIGLPQRYEPAELDLKAFRITLRGHAATLSPFLKSLFDQPYDLQVSASWYHDSTVLPPYLCIRISPKDRDFHYELSIDLETSRLIHLKVVKHYRDKSMQFFEVALSSTDVSNAQKKEP